MTHTVLLVDDDTNLLAGLVRALRREPYTVLASPGPAEALDVLAARPVDVVVCDHNMPGMSGVDLIARLRVRHPTVMRIMLTGAPSLDLAIRAINVGEIFRFLRKPCAQEELVAAIRQAIQQKELESQSRRLLGNARQQRVLIERLEAENPGITRVKRDSGGAVVLDESSTTDVGELLRDLTQENERAESALASSPSMSKTSRPG
jgi:DNA-binding NtrC family response regulator